MSTTTATPISGATVKRRITATQKETVAATEKLEGFILLNSAMKPLFVNSAAVQILAYPQKVETIEHLDEYIASKMRSNALLERSSRAPTLVARFQSGKRLYLCRFFRVNAVTQSDAHPSVAIILERCSERRISLYQVSVTFHLTTREQEVFQQLVEAGLTTKEIAVRMGISPNTVKAFLRLIMVKMGVNTRSGIVAKALSVQQS